MKQYSNKYIFLYITILVALVAVLLSVVTIKLKPLQDNNREIEKMQQILYAAGYKNVVNTDAQNLFSNICEEWVIDKTGSVTSKYHEGSFTQGNIRAFNLDDKSEYFNAQNGKDYQLPIFVINNNGSNIFVVPVRGKGLWGPIWGYIAIANDGKTVVGTVFSHKSETPGLGAEIAKDKFQSEFKNKMIFDQNNKFVSVHVIKGGVASSNYDPKYAVDALSGATSTSKGVDNMLNTCLEYYVPFFNNYLK